MVLVKFSHAENNLITKINHLYFTSTFFEGRYTNFFQQKLLICVICIISIANKRHQISLLDIVLHIQHTVLAFVYTIIYKNSLICGLHNADWLASIFIHLEFPQEHSFRKQGCSFRKHCRQVWWCYNLTSIYGTSQNRIMNLYKTSSICVSLHCRIIRALTILVYIWLSCDGAYISSHGDRLSWGC